MNLEQLLAKCPECGSKDKTIKKRFIDDQLAQTELEAIVCDECGYVFETPEDNEEK